MIKGNFLNCICDRLIQQTHLIMESQNIWVEFSLSVCTSQFFCKLKMDMGDMSKYDSKVAESRPK